MAQYNITEIFHLKYKLFLVHYSWDVWAKVAGLKRADGAKGVLGTVDSDHQISVLPVGQGWAKQGSGVLKHCVLCNSYYWLLWSWWVFFVCMLVFVARILTFSFMLFDSRMKWRKPLASLVCCRNRLIVFCLHDWNMNWRHFPFLYLSLHNVDFSSCERNSFLQPAELNLGCDCPWSGVRCLGWYLKRGYILEWWDVVLVNIS